MQEINISFYDLIKKDYSECLSIIQELNSELNDTMRQDVKNRQ